MNLKEVHQTVAKDYIVTTIWDGTEGRLTAGRPSRMTPKNHNISLCDLAV